MLLDDGDRVPQDVSLESDLAEMLGAKSVTIVQATIIALATITNTPAELAAQAGISLGAVGAHKAHVLLVKPALQPLLRSFVMDAVGPHQDRVVHALLVPLETTYPDVLKRLQAAASYAKRAPMDNTSPDAGEHRREPVSPAQHRAQPGSTWPAVTPLGPMPALARFAKPVHQDPT